MMMLHWCLHHSRIFVVSLFVSLPCTTWSFLASNQSPFRTLESRSNHHHVRPAYTCQLFQARTLQLKVANGSQQDGPSLVDSTKEPTIIIANARPVAGVTNLLRCASTDNLGTIIRACTTTTTTNEEEKADGDRLSAIETIIWRDAGLIIDLRSKSERNEELAQDWMKTAPGGPIKVIEASSNTGKEAPFSAMDVYSEDNDDNKERSSSSTTKQRRTVIRIDVLLPSRFAEYIDKTWFSAFGRLHLQAGWYKLVDGGALHDLRIQSLNQRGLAGLNEILLETAKQEFAYALQLITLQLEQYPEDPVVFHCVKGKDRTGMLAMLIQSLVGISEEDIVADYFLSNQELLLQQQGTAELTRQQEEGQVDRTIFSGTSREAMTTTLEFVRNKYGSVSPGYLDSIGFDMSWRQRLQKVVIPVATE